MSPQSALAFDTNMFVVRLCSRKHQQAFDGIFILHTSALNMIDNDAKRYENKSRITLDTIDRSTKTDLFIVDSCIDQ
jgi:hypothetical protein